MSPPTCVGSSRLSGKFRPCSGKDVRSPVCREDAPRATETGGLKAPTEPRPCGEILSRGRTWAGWAPGPGAGRARPCGWGFAPSVAGKAGTPCGGPQASALVELRGLLAGRPGPSLPSHRISTGDRGVHSELLAHDPSRPPNRNPAQIIS